MCDRTYGLLLSPQQLDSETCLSFAMVVKGSCWTSVRPGVPPGVPTATVGLAPLAPVAGMSTLLASRQLLIRVWLEFVDLARRRMSGYVRRINSGVLRGSLRTSKKSYTFPIVAAIIVLTKFRRLCWLSQLSRHMSKPQGGAGFSTTQRLMMICPRPPLPPPLSLALSSH